MKEYLLFTCSTINPDQLFTNEPWNYVSLDPAGNNLEPDLQKLKKKLDEMQMHGPVRLRIIIGNTDPYYIYLQQLQTVPEPARSMTLEQFQLRWGLYLDAFAAWIGERIPGAAIDVVSWREEEKRIGSKNGTDFEKEFESVYRRIKTLFSRQDFRRERQALDLQFREGGYFYGMEKPNDAVLEDWVLRKFAEYAVQGDWLAREFPDAVLIQNEKPSELRTRMYQPLVRERQGKELTVEYWFGIDNKGYA